MIDGTRTYLGDGVYAEVRDGGYHVVLTTNNGQHVTNEIFLDPNVVHLLLEFIAAMKASNQEKPQ